MVCLAPHEPLGRIQEVFGPVQGPLYALAYAGGPPMPAALAPGAPVLAVERLSQFVVTEQLGRAEVSVPCSCIACAPIRQIRKHGT